MIHLALWLVSLVIVAGFALLVLGGIVSLFSGAGPRPQGAPPPSTSTNKDSDTPPWVSAACYIGFFAGPVGGAMFADEANRNPAAPMPGWLYVALGVIGGAIAAASLYVLLMKEVSASRKEKARRLEEHESNVGREHQRVRQEARAAALAAYPDYLDDDMLRDPAGPYAWPADLFARLFVVPDVVIPYKTKFGHDGEVNLWSKMYVAQQSADPDYAEYKAALDLERAEVERAQRREEEDQREAEREAREAEEVSRAEAEALAARKSGQLVIPFDQLKGR